jgi:hypothetical protein
MHGPKSNVVGDGSCRKWVITPFILIFKSENVADFFFNVFSILDVEVNNYINIK